MQQYVRSYSSNYTDCANEAKNLSVIPNLK